jgi:hypothetical protein
MNRNERMRAIKYREAIQFLLGNIMAGDSGERAVTAYPCGGFPL